MFDLDKPVIAAVNGLAAGGGFEMVLACDLIVAADHAEFFLPELGIGVVPDAGGAQRLPRRLPWFVAMDLLLTSRRMGAREAVERGLVRSVVPATELLGEARRLAEHIAGCPPSAVQATKEIARRAEGLHGGGDLRADGLRRLAGVLPGARPRTASARPPAALPRAARAAGETGDQ